MITSLHPKHSFIPKSLQIHLARLLDILLHILCKEAGIRVYLSASRLVNLRLLLITDCLLNFLLYWQPTETIQTQ
jgi:hypothetical protein